MKWVLEYTTVEVQKSGKVCLSTHENGKSVWLTVVYLEMLAARRYSILQVKEKT